MKLSNKWERRRNQHLEDPKNIDKLKNIELKSREEQKLDREESIAK